MAASTAGNFLAEHLVRYEDLIPCTTAFIDTRTPGSSQKENFTIIGPGVAENPDQHVHIARAHGFNIGGARQPPHCVNSQHSHDTAEVFVVHSGTWRFTSGERADDGAVVLKPGDTISIPTQAFRGFENIGEDVGFLFAVLGGDDPGRVLWAPYVFENARDYGLVLLENGRLIDTAAGEQVPNDEPARPVTTRDQVAALTVLTDDDLEGCVVRRDDLAADPASDLAAPGIVESPIIGTTGRLAWSHGFHVRHLALDAGAGTASYIRPQEEVLLMQSGRLEVTIDDEPITLEPGDVLSVPIDAARRLANPGDGPCEVYAVHGSDAPGYNT